MIGALTPRPGVAPLTNCPSRTIGVPLTTTYLMPADGSEGSL